MSGPTIRRSCTICTAAVFALLAPACVVGPNYHPAKVNVPGQWAGLSADSKSNPSVATGDAGAITEWWQGFHDQELDSLISQAALSNLSVQEAQSRIRQAREAGKIAGAGLWPNVNASGSFTSSNTALTGTSAAAAGSSTRNLFQAGLDAAWELDFFGGVRRSVESANANTQATVEDSRDVLVSLTAEVALNYVGLRGTQRQIAIARENLEAQKQTAQLTHKRFDVGFASRLDVANAEAQVATTQAQIPALEATAQQTIYNLSVLLGREPQSLIAELSPEGTIPPPPPVVPVGIPSDLLERRPDIRRAEAQVHAATAQIGVAKAELFPQFSLTGSAGGQSLTSGSLGSLAGKFWSAGPALTLPIFNAGRIRANIRLQTAAQEQAVLAYRQTVLTALQEVESALIAYTKDQQQRSALADAVKSNGTAVDLSTRLYTAGQGEFLNVLTAQRSLYATQDALVQSDRTIDTDLIALYKALGGGWERLMPAGPTPAP